MGAKQKVMQNTAFVQRQFCPKKTFLKSGFLNIREMLLGRTGRGKTNKERIMCRNLMDWIGLISMGSIKRQNPAKESPSLLAPNSSLGFRVYGLGSQAYLPRG